MTPRIVKTNSVTTWRVPSREAGRLAAAAGDGVGAEADHGNMVDIDHRLA